MHNARNVSAVLGPTNTGKTHLAVARMLDYETGMIGLPLRLLAREVYDKICSRAGTESVALITGEEKIVPPEPRFYVCTVEAMPRDLKVDFLAVDEVQLAADLDRGHIFTDHVGGHFTVFDRVVAIGARPDFRHCRYSPYQSTLPAPARRWGSGSVLA